MFCIAYFSTATSEFDENSILEILDVSRSYNTEYDITGVLGYYDRSFFQVLEGNKQSVSNLFNRISLDRRNKSVTPIYQSNIDTRSFEDWSMALATPQILGPERQAFCIKLASLKPHIQASHHGVVMKMIDIFNTWVN